MKKVVYPKINYGALKTGDIVSCGGVGPFAYAIRLFTKGLKYRRDIKTVSTHTGMIIDLVGQKFIAEMNASGLQINSLEIYRKNRRKFIIGISRSSELTDICRIGIEKKISLDYRKGIEYDWSGDLAFITKLVKENPKKRFCSEYAAYILKIYGGVEVRENESEITPVDFQYPSNVIPSLHEIKFEV